MKTWVIAIVAVLVVVVGAFVGVKKVSPLSWGMWGTYNTSAGLALKGYDPVAYVLEAKANELGAALFVVANELQV